MKTYLLVIDPQYDFCHPNGSLFIPDAPDDILRINELISNNAEHIDDIIVTCDSHPYVHIAHPIWFVDADGNHPEPFTQLKLDGEKIVSDKGKEFKTFHENSENWTKHYLKITKHPHIIWPYHCINGSLGQTVCIEESLKDWSCSEFANPTFYLKGGTPHTECYSAVCESTGELLPHAQHLIQTLASADRVLVCGEASTHCVAETVRDLRYNYPKLDSKLVILADCMSPVPGFEQEEENFFNELRAANVRIATKNEIEKELKNV